MKYDKVASFYEGIARVGLNAMYGFIDMKGNEITPLKYNDAWYFNDGFAPVRLNDKEGYVDKWGREYLKYGLKTIPRLALY